MYRKENKGIVSTSNQWTERLPHPANMDKYDRLNSKPEVHIAIELLTHMVAPDVYVQMLETDDTGKEIAPDHPNIKKVQKWMRDKNFRSKYKQIVRTKISKGFCPVEILSDKSIKLLPPESFYIYRDKKGTVTKYTQEINNSVVAEWSANDPSILLFIQNEDPTHPYGVAISDSIADLIECRDQLNMDMPKIIHRFSAPTMTVISDQDVTAIKTAIEDKDLDEAVYIGNANPDTLKIEFHEPDARVKFTEYIELVNFQIAEELHAPLILLLKNATEASATKMLEAVDRYVQAEQDENAEVVEQRIFKRLVGEPTPEFLHGAPNSTLKDITLDQIGTLKGNGTITWKQAQDLIRKKGIELIEDEQPAPPAILQSADNMDEKPLINKDKTTQLELQLQTIKANYEANHLIFTEALKEADRAINNTIEKAKMEANRQLKVIGKALTPESEAHFKFVHDAYFRDFRNSILPVEA
jgi:hypothetical protein